MPKETGVSEKGQVWGSEQRQDPMVLGWLDEACSRVIRPPDGQHPADVPLMLHDTDSRQQP